MAPHCHSGSPGWRTNLPFTGRLHLVLCLPPCWLSHPAPPPPEAPLVASSWSLRTALGRKEQGRILSRGTNPETAASHICSALPVAWCCLLASVWSNAGICLSPFPIGRPGKGSFQAEPFIRTKNRSCHPSTCSYCVIVLVVLVLVIARQALHHSSHAPRPLAFHLFCI